MHITRPRVPIWQLQRKKATAVSFVFKEFWFLWADFVLLIKVKATWKQKKLSPSFSCGFRFRMGERVGVPGLLLCPVRLCFALWPLEFLVLLLVLFASLPPRRFRSAFRASAVSVLMTFLFLFQLATTPEGCWLVAVTVGNWRAWGTSSILQGYFSLLFSFSRSFEFFVLVQRAHKTQNFQITRSACASFLHWHCQVGVFRLSALHCLCSVLLSFGLAMWVLNLTQLSTKCAMQIS